MRNKRARVVLTPGLGNQLFQLNKGIQLTGLGIEVEYIFFKKYIGKHGFIFNDLLDIKPVNGRFYEMIIYILWQRAHTFVCAIKNLSPIFGKLSENIFDNLRVGSLYLGYWQSPYAISHSTLKYVSNFFKLSLNKNSLVIHCRNGDFTNSIYADLHDFYRKQLLVLNFDTVDSMFIVTDDANGVYTNYVSKLLESLGYKHEIICSNIKDDFMFLASSQFLIGSNSSFCYVAGMLGKYLFNTTPVFPDHIFKDFSGTMVCR